MEINGLPLIVIAMEAEATPVRDLLGLEGVGSPIDDTLNARIWSSERIHLVVNGMDSRFGIDSIGTIPAALTTFAAVKSSKPGLVISAGTCGGFVRNGGHIGEVIIADRCVFHDHRIALPGFSEYGFGEFPLADMSEVASSLGYRLGTVTTGDSLDAPFVDLKRMDSVSAAAKDMEAAAVAWVSSELNIPFTALKVITDLVDGEEATETEFLANLQYASERLAEAIFAVVTKLHEPND